MKSRWTLKPQEGNDGPVEVKFGHYVPQETDSGVKIIRLNPMSGWIAVHLERNNPDGSKTPIRVHRTMRGNWIVHHPDSQEYILTKGCVTNPLDPATKVVKNKWETWNVESLREYLVSKTRSPELIDKVLNLIDGEYQRVLIEAA